MNNLIRITVLLCLVAGNAAGAITYDFRQISRSDIQTMPPVDMMARAVIDGNRSRVDFVRGSTWGDGTYVIAQHSPQQMIVVDPSKKTYAELEVSSLAAALGSRKVELANVKSQVETLPDSPVIAGLPTKHVRLTTTYDMTVHFGMIAITQAVRTIVDRWTTTALGDVAGAFFTAGPLRTGHPDVDQLIEAETTKLSGFPLKQIVTIITSSDRPPGRDSQLKINPTRRQSSEMVVTAIRQGTADPRLFEVPAGYTKTDDLTKSKDDSKIHVLTMEPESTPQ